VKQYRLGLYEKSMPGTLGFGEKLAAAKSSGFDYLELSIDETDEKLARLDWSGEEIKSLRRDMEDTGVPVLSICLSGHRRFPLGSEDQDVQNRSLEIMDKACSLALALGVRIIQIAGYDVYYSPSNEQSRENFARNLALSAEIASQAGVVLAFETMETPFMNTVEKAMYWVDKINSPWLRVYPDIGNVTNAVNGSAAAMVKDLENGRGSIAAIHLKETRPEVYREVPYGQGHVDFSQACLAGSDLGVRLFVGEFWHKGEENWPDILKANARFLRGYLDKAFFRQFSILS
jgi:predicted hexulose-6-phosphate isomerase